MRPRTVLEGTDYFEAENLARRREMASRGGVSDDIVNQVRAIVGPEPSDMDIIRALYQSKNDVSSALNILFDTPAWKFKPSPKPQNRRPPPPPPPLPPPPPVPTSSNAPPPKPPVPASSNAPPKPPVPASSKAPPLKPPVPPRSNAPPPSQPRTGVPTKVSPSPPIALATPGDSSVRVSVSKAKNLGTPERIDLTPVVDLTGEFPKDLDELQSQVLVRAPAEMARNAAANAGVTVLEVPNVAVVDNAGKMNSVPKAVAMPSVVKPRALVKRKSSQPVAPTFNLAEYERFIDPAARPRFELPSEDFLFMGQTAVTCLSTCKGTKLSAGESLTFSYPKSGYEINSDGRRGWGRGRGTVSGADIVRFSTVRSGEIGRLPGEWARPLIPLKATGKVEIKATCIHCPVVLGLLDSIHVELGIFVSTELLKNKAESSATSISVSSDSTTHNPLLSVLRLLKKKPVQKAEFSPEDLYSRKRSLDLEAAKKNGTAASEPILSAEKRQKLSGASANPSEEKEAEEISESDLTKVVGTSEGSELPELDPPSTILCELRPYQKQALHWMTKMEAGLELEDAAKTLHPCWESYHLGDGKTLFYVNIFSGDASLNFPSALQTARGGILADAMGLGKTVMGIALMLKSPGKGGLYSASLAERAEASNAGEIGASSSSPNEADKSPAEEEDITEAVAKKPRIKDSHGLLKGGGTLIVCPMTLLAQWKTELETHVQPDLLSIYTYYGPDRVRDFNSFLEYDVVLTTYGVMSSDSNNQTSGSGGLFGIHWYRIILDEAHSIKGLRTQMSQAAFKLTADCRWCLTGTPIQNKLEDVYSLLHFLRIEPWGNYGWWTKLIQKPFDEGDERGLRLLQAILRPLMLRRTKETTDKEGRPILVLPPADMQVIQCELSEAERDFYEALFRKSKVKFDMFVEQGRVLHNYASILELLLRLRQCCDHPFLVMSRGDTDEYADLNKLARHFMNGDGGDRAGPTRAYVEEVVNDIRKGEKAECPICLEVVEDAVLTPCAHCLCRECLFASWPGYGGGPCPICRKYISRHDIITAPTENRFHLDVEKNWRASSKVLALMNELEKVDLAGEKSVVFSQWTSFLDLLQIPLARAKVMYVRLDGTLSQQKRAEVIKEFQTNPKVKVMLISLKAGGVGVNLTAASHAFVLDPWWNPAVEEQAIMRIHRIGQLRNVFIKRFICKDTVEERMQQVQARKQRMIAGALNNHENKANRLEELKMLFR